MSSRYEFILAIFEKGRLRWDIAYPPLLISLECISEDKRLKAISLFGACEISGK
tara:strand:+ start:1830 stop:1991 length:162 start_codon:yes stop_codon:yes gene_type:complete